jgi:hypothetical protein
MLVYLSTYPSGRPYSPTLPLTHTSVHPPAQHLLTRPTNPLTHPPPSVKSHWPTKTGRILINKLEHVCPCKQMIQQRFSVLSSVTWRCNPLSRGMGLFCFGFISPACHVESQECRHERLNFANLLMSIELDRLCL